MKIYETDIKNIIFQVISNYGIQIKNDSCLCPFHNDHNPSLKIYFNGTKFKCFTCGEQGDSIDFIQKFEKINEKEAIGIFQRIIGKNNQAEVEYKEEKKETEPKYHVRKISNDNPRFLWYEKKKLSLSDPTEEDIVNIQKIINKKFSLDTLQKANVKINKNPYGIVFGTGKSLFYNPKNKKTYLHFEGRTDWLTAIELKLYEYFCLVSDYNKENIWLEDGSKHYFILDRDDSKENKISSLTKRHNIKTKKLKFISLPPEYKDLCEYYNIGNCQQVDILNLITEAKTNSGSLSVSKTIIEKDNCYWGVTNEESLRCLSNFTMELVYETTQGEGKRQKREYFLKFTDYQGEQTNVILTSKEWGQSMANFDEAIGNYGRFIFFGKYQDFKNVKQYIYEKYEKKLINQPSNYGKIEKDVWLFKNGIVAAGEYIPFDDDKIAYIDEEKTIGYTIAGKKDKDINCKITTEKISVKDIFGNFYSLYGNLAYKQFGFATFTAFNDVLFEKYNVNPVMFFAGKSQSGKTTGALLTSSLLGAEVKLNLTSTTKGIARTLANYKNLPVILDESMNAEDRIKQGEQDNMIIAGYDKTGYNRATKTNDNATETTEVNSSLIYISEFYPTREAVINRSVLFDFNPIEKQNKLFNNMLEHKIKNSSFLLDVLKHIDIKDIINNIEMLKEYFYQYNYEKRIIDNHCIIYGCFLALAKKFNLISDKQYSDETYTEMIKDIIINDMNRIKSLADNSNIYKQYFERLQMLLDRKDLTEYCFIKDNALCFNNKHCFEKIKEIDNRTTRDLKANKNDIQVYIEQALEIKTKPIRNYSSTNQASYVFKGYEIPISELIKNNLWEER